MTKSSPFAALGRLLPGRLRDRRLPTGGVLLGTAVLVGFATGLGGMLFRWLIHAVQEVSFDWLPRATADWGMAYVVIAPAAGGLLVGPLIYFLAREAKGHGVPEVMEAVALRGGRIRPRVAVVKSLASALTIGSGGSVGREGPIVQIGSTIGSTVGQWLGFSDDRVRNLVAAGAAGGIAATFNAPIAGVLFALEVILGDYSAHAIGTVVVSAVVASVVGRAAFGDEAAFGIPEYAINSLWEFPLYFLLGIVAAFVGTVYARSIYGAEDVFDNVTRIPEWLKPAVGGVLLGCMALGYSQFPGLGFDRVPQVYGVGYETITSGLLGQQTAMVMLALMVLKIASTSLTLGSGGSGGVFAPSLFIGSMLGGSFGLLMHSAFPGIPAHPGAYALVGMGAVFAGATHASMTAVIMMFEMTGDYNIILPLMLAVVTSSLLSRRLLHGETIYTLKLARRGVRLERGRDIDVLQAVHVEEVMSEPIPVAPNTTLDELTDLFLNTNRHGFAVLDDAGRLAGIVSITDVRGALRRGQSGETCVTDLMTTEVVTIFPDDTLDVALRKLGPRDLSRLPVVSREDPKRLIGILRRNDIVRAYNVALTRRYRGGTEVQSALQRTPTVEVVEFQLADGASCIGKSVAELSQVLPAESLLISIRRIGGEVVFPHGDTRLASGDSITACARKGQVPQLKRCFDVA